jgi:hypothetical protein
MDIDLGILMNYMSRLNDLTEVLALAEKKLAAALVDIRIAREQFERDFGLATQEWQDYLTGIKKANE